MTLLALQDADLTNLDVRFRQSPLAPLIASLVFFSVAAGTIVWYWRGGLPWAAALVLGGLMVLMGLLLLSHFRKAMAPTNWVLAVGPGRVLVKFRSYLNAHFPQADPQVVLLEPSEIVCARMTRQRLRAPGLHGHTETSFPVFLDLCCAASVDLTPLRERIKYERLLKPQKVSKHCSAKAQHYPVCVGGTDTIRIEWPSSGWIVAPGMQRALAALGKQGIAVGPLHKEIIDLTVRGRKDRENAQDQILRLAERGNLPAATRLARRVYGLNLTEARQFVEDLLQ